MGVNHLLLSRLITGPKGKSGWLSIPKILGGPPIPTMHVPDVSLRRVKDKFFRFPNAWIISFNQRFKSSWTLVKTFHEKLASLILSAKKWNWINVRVMIHFNWLTPVKAFSQCSIGCLDVLPAAKDTGRSQLASNQRGRSRPFKFRLLRTFWQKKIMKISFIKTQKILILCVQISLETCFSEFSGFLRL